MSNVDEARDLFAPYRKLIFASPCDDGGEHVVMHFAHKADRLEHDLSIVEAANKEREFENAALRIANLRLHSDTPIQLVYVERRHGERRAQNRRKGGSLERRSVE